MKNKKAINCCETNPIVGVAGTIGGTTLVMILFIVLFAKESAGEIIPTLTVSMAIMGSVLGIASSIRKNK